MPRILFVKTSSLGDVVHQCPAVSDAARGIPGASIDWVVEDAFAGVARMHPGVARVIPVALRRWRRAPWRPAVWREMAAFREALRGAPYDAVIDTQGLLKSALITCFTSGTKWNGTGALRRPRSASACPPRSTMALRRKDLSAKRCRRPIRFS